MSEPEWVEIGYFYPGECPAGYDPCPEPECIANMPEASMQAAEMFPSVDYDLSEENLRGAWK